VIWIKKDGATTLSAAVAAAQTPGDANQDVLSALVPVVDEKPVPNPTAVEYPAMTGSEGVSPARSSINPTDPTTKDSEPRTEQSTIRDTSSSAFTPTLPTESCQAKPQQL
jgi:hypothetical protein